jgi:DNA-binding NtrC family response regulator
MPKRGEATVTDLSETADATTPRSQESLALVIAGCVLEPERDGEIGFVPLLSCKLVGRVDPDTADEDDDPLVFGRQLPGEGPPMWPGARALRGHTISSVQLEVRGTVEGLKVTRVGKLDTFVNGELLAKGDMRIVKAGGAILLKGQVVLVCVLRPTTLPALRAPRAVQPLGEPDEGGFAGESVDAWNLRDLATVAAETPDHVLVLGESGTGKELVTALVHKRSDRAHRDLVDFNAASFVESLKESTLVGNEKNYPERGTEMRPGLLGEADGGMLFLDEIGDCAIPSQLLLFRTMETGRYRPLGSTGPRTTDLRVIAATNQSTDRLRPELFGRFTTRIYVPPLDTRREDIALILRQLTRLRAKLQPRIATQYCRVSPSGALFPRFDPRFVDYVIRHPLTRNARDILAILAAAIANSPEDVILVPPPSAFGLEDGPQAVVTAPPSAARERASQGGEEDDEDAKVERVRAVLVRVGWNLTRAADELGMDRTTLRRFTQKHGLTKSGT